MRALCGQFGLARKLRAVYNVYMIANTRLCTTAILLLLAHSPTLADSITGRVSRVIDGDTVIVVDRADSQVRVRLADIDAPEMRQPYGPQAKAALVTMSGGKQVTVTYTRRDRYGRILGTLTIGNRNINLTMVQSGHAWRYRYARNTGVIADAERFARENRLGLWRAGGVVEPWAYRARRR